MNEGGRGDGQLYSVADGKTDLVYQYSYDSQGRLMSSSVTDVSDPDNPVKVITTRQTYDANNQLSAQYWQLGSTQYSETYTYSKTTGLLATHKPAVGNTLSYGYDTLQRLSTVNGGIYGKTYTYRNTTGNNTTTQVSQLKYSLPTAITYGYTYDVLGNIATYTEAGTTYTYTYDAQNQLTKQTGGGKTYTYSYDAAGNILSASNGTTTHSYTYGNTTWRDLLTKFDGQSITYDNAGNPTSYYNGARWTMTWAEGRRLVTASKSGTSLSFTYDSDGLRLSKNVNGTVHNYSYAGNKLMRETWGSNTLDFFYDSTGTPYALKYNGTLYYYITNLQGDVLKIVNTSGTPVVSYSYDPYGKPTVTSDTSGVSLGTINPLRYRGYVYDTESGLYYLQSRYYDPNTARFINADALVSTGQGVTGCNMFAYCNNNPATFFDSTGNSACQLAQKLMEGGFGGISGASDTSVGGAEIAVAVGILVVSAAKEIYALARTLTNYALSYYDNRQPRVHHVIPRGDFSYYSQETVDNLRYMHELLISVEISIDDPENLVIISQGTHKSMHTENYINTIYDIMSQARPGDKASVRQALFWARIYAASLDQYPLLY